jgi:hypothetical protein
MGEFVRRGVSIQNSILALVLCAALSACGTAGGNGGGGNSGGGGNGGGGTQMQAGQWEFVVTPNDGSDMFYVEANLTPSGETVFAAVANTGIYQQQTFTGEGIGAGFCSNQTLNGNISGDTLTGNTNDGGSSSYATFSATIAANNQSVSGGTYTGGSCGFDGSTTTGTLTGYVVAPLNGTFTGTLTSSLYGPDQVSIVITQNSGFDFTVSGTSVEDGESSTISVPLGSSNGGANDYSNVIGATINAYGTTTNINGTSNFQAVGHFNPAGTQLAIRTLDTKTGEVNTGTLTKQ